MAQPLAARTRVAPHAGAWIETHSVDGLHRTPLSRPTRARGLNSSVRFSSKLSLSRPHELEQIVLVRQTPCRGSGSACLPQRPPRRTPAGRAWPSARTTRAARATRARARSAGSHRAPSACPASACPCVSPASSRRRFPGTPAPRPRTLRAGRCEPGAPRREWSRTAQRGTSRESAPRRS